MAKKLFSVPKLNKGDKVATVSLSWGGAGDQDIRWRYEQGKRQLEETFGLEVFEIHRGNALFPAIEDFEGAILFFETSEETPPEPKITIPYGGKCVIENGKVFISK